MLNGARTSFHPGWKKDLWSKSEYDSVKPGAEVKQGCTWDAGMLMG